jgi:hypothetical protein
VRATTAQFVLAVTASWELPELVGVDAAAVMAVAALKQKGTAFKSVVYVVAGYNEYPEAHVKQVKKVYVADAPVMAVDEHVAQLATPFNKESEVALQA